jgi:NADPH:quinone reductase-like Zn-dependent oxidoreductase
VDENALAFKPVNISMAEAASIPLVALTAWQVLVETAHVKEGQKVLIHAGAGGVGTLAIQLAKHLGAFVATTTSTANVEWVKALGADVVIDYKQQNFESILRDYDVVLNSLGADILEKSLKVLKPGGQLISISGPPTPQFAQERGAAWAIKQVMRVLSYGIRRASRASAMRSYSCRHRARNCKKSPSWSSAAFYGPSSTVPTRLSQRQKHCATSNRADQKAR